MQKCLLLFIIVVAGYYYFLHQDFHQDLRINSNSYEIAEIRKQAENNTKEINLLSREISKLYTRIEAIEKWMATLNNKKKF